ncbi:HAD family acid phosphatase [Streptomyces sp. NPDC001817]|uniref:HAD family acid phosphatase n=1 Tax=Streptomyces sp. NPDC001817 TaxID=3154398 RepID=UPI00331913A1
MGFTAKLAITAMIVAVTCGVALPAVAAPAHPTAAVTAHATITESSVTETQWLADVSTAIAPAYSWVEQRTTVPSSRKLAIVFDIDNTTLASYFHPFTEPAVQAVLQLAQFAHQRGVAVMFVTGRLEFIDPITWLSLNNSGYPVDALYSRDWDQLLEPLQTFKTDQRIAIEQQGYTIISNLGNNWSDLDGGHAERTFKLPDYNGLLS